MVRGRWNFKLIKRCPFIIPWLTMGEVKFQGVLTQVQMKPQLHQTPVIKLKKVRAQTRLSLWPHVIQSTGPAPSFVFIFFLPSWDSFSTHIPLWTRASLIHFSGTPVRPRGPVFSIVWTGEPSSLVPALRALTWMIKGPFSGTVTATVILTLLLVMGETWLSSVAPERPSILLGGAWSPVSWVTGKMSGGGWPVPLVLAREGRASSTWGSRSWTARGWVMLATGRPIWPGWTGPPLVIVWIHLRWICMKGIVTWGSGVIETWLP